MIYDYETSINIILRIYEYLQIKATREMPRTIKMDKPRHRDAVISFLQSIPPTGGVDFVWEFLTFQFYVYAHQDHQLRPMPVWFMGKEAWRRWAEYDDGIKFYVHKWVTERSLKNPVKSDTYKPVSAEILRKERDRMSRITGPNFCQAKYGSNPYNPDDVMCNECPFKKDCELLFATRNKLGESLFEEVEKSYSPIIDNCVNMRIKTHKENYGDF